MLAPKALKELRPGPLQRDKNLAGFSRGFRFTQQKHICAAAKKRRRTDVKTKNPNPRKIYETQSQQIRGHFALRMFGHYLLAHDVGDYPRA